MQNKIGLGANHHHDHMTTSNQHQSSTLESKLTLTPYYPARAGQAEKALKSKLADLDRLNKRMRDSRLPPASEVEKGVIGRMWLRMKRRRYGDASNDGQEPLNEEVLNAEFDAIEKQAALCAVKNATYRSGRRNGYGELPGLVPHYPNNLYEETALAERINTVQNDQKTLKRSLLATLFRGKGVETKDEPVGRRNFDVDDVSVEETSRAGTKQEHTSEPLTQFVSTRANSLTDCKPAVKDETETKTEEKVCY